MKLIDLFESHGAKFQFVMITICVSAVVLLLFLLAGCAAGSSSVNKIQHLDGIRDWRDARYLP